MNISIPSSTLERIVILGAGFAGLRLARKLANKNYQVVLIDRNNFHQFQPLFYQVATAGLAPSSISFPVRLIFHNTPNVHFRMAEIERIDLEQNLVHTSIGPLGYDKLVIALGANTNFFGNQNIQKHAYPMKSVSEALDLRNRVIECMEQALVTEDEDERTALMNVVIVGGGPTGTEVAGAISEMKRYVLPKDYPELDFDRMSIRLIEGSSRLLNGMREQSSIDCLTFLQRMGVQVDLSTLVKDYDGRDVMLSNGAHINCATLIWAAGVRGVDIEGIPEHLRAPGNRIKVDAYNRMEGFSDVFVIGDLAIMNDVNDGKGDPQVAQVALQHADSVYSNLRRADRNRNLKPFKYKDLGSMATIGRNKAVVDLPQIHFKGFFAWVFWLFVHLMSILGVKNKFFIFMEWMWNYFTFDQSLRLVIKKGNQT